jgi:2-polyprenyl-3-methyl-5-hydroxy-6-metoxy-1,4-benzoquinol methylase
MMSRSYFSDDQAFQKLRAAGKSSWDEQSDPQATFDNFLMRPFIEDVVATFESPLKGMAALEIGCGTGPVSCFLASKGMDVLGIDVSPTALEMARRNAAERGLVARFEPADICRFSDHAHRYDLIVDGHCLHCLVWDDHRRAAFEAMYRLLKPGGVLLIETMISHPSLAVAGNYQLDVQGVLSIKVDSHGGIDGVYRSGNDWFAPYRRLRTAERFVAELESSGFEVQFRREALQADVRKPMLMQVRASRRL